MIENIRNLIFISRGRKQQREQWQLQEQCTEHHPLLGQLLKFQQADLVGG